MFNVFASQSIEYEREGEKLTFLATAGKSEGLADANTGMILAYDAADWIFPVANIASLGDPYPKAGDTITTTTGDVFTVLMLDGQKPYLLDEFAIDVRVHTKRTGTI